MFVAVLLSVYSSIKNAAAILYNLCLRVAGRNKVVGGSRHNPTCGSVSSVADVNKYNYRDFDVSRSGTRPTSAAPWRAAVINVATHGTR